MKDISEMTVEEHHELCIGVLACCYKHVPPDLQRAIMEGLRAAQQMGMDITPDNVLTGEPLHNEIRILGA